MLLASCGSSKQAADPFMTKSPGDDADSGRGADGGGPGPVAGDAMSPLLGGDGGGVASDASCSGTHCSADLHSVLDCQNQVVTTCPADQGCASGGCVGPCDAAGENRSTIGCDYFAVVPDVTIGPGLPFGGGCFAAYIANTWNGPVTLTVDYNGQSLDPSTFAYVPSGTGQNITYTLLANGQLAAGQVAIVFLNEMPTIFSSLPGTDTNCPTSVTAAITTLDAAQHGTGVGHAFHISTSAPVVAYDIYPYGGGQSAVTSATLLLPTSSWDTNYVAVDAYEASQLSGGVPFVDFVTETDGTTITINPSTAIVGGTGVAATAQGTPYKYGPFSRGQVLHLAQTNELIGSIVQSSSPIGAWGGHQCLNVDPNTAACDSAHQQIPPVRALGSEYVGVRYRNRWQGNEESVPWRLVGAANGTTLTYEPQAPAGAPTTLSLGQMAEFESTGLFVVRSQDAAHPFYVAAYMTGADTQPMAMANSDGRGDPEFVNVIPPAEYLSSYVFFTDPTYPETDLVVVRTAGTTGFQDVTLDCAGVLTGWQPLGSSGAYEYLRVDLVTGNFVPQGNCNNGRHEMTSGNPFGLTVWGWGSAATGLFSSQYVSYAYPAGQSIAPINTVTIPAVPQ